MNIIDSSVWIDFFNGLVTTETALLDQLLVREPVGIGDLILAEVLQGFTADQDYEAAKRHLKALPCFSMGGTQIALKSAENYRNLRKKGITNRKTIDMFIATFCIENNHILLHNDRDFDPMEHYLGLNTLKK
ncbi:MAG: PIN domain nuclease [Bacteroidetes bacterium]|nr:PIN domain nuclease [Bacteroidota bacterium]